VINPENTLEFVCPNKHEVSGKCICLMFSFICACTNVTFLGVFNGEVSFQGVALWF
jgi:hypothetical protein